MKKKLLLLFILCLSFSAAFAQTNGQNTQSALKRTMSRIEVMESEHIRLMENLKTCTRSEANVITGKQYVLGPKNNKCYFRMDFGTQGDYVSCMFPFDAARRYAQETIKQSKAV